MTMSKWKKAISAVKWLLLVFAAVFLLLGTGGCGPAVSESGSTETAAVESIVSDSAAADSTAAESAAIEEDGEYTSKEEVALYLHTYSHLPQNYITKQEAKALGWVSEEGNLDEVAPGKSIGGDRFGNYEGLLPEEDGRQYYECDIDYDGGTRNAKRIIYSNDGLIFYTEDHYKTFEQLY